MKLKAWARESIIPKNQNLFNYLPEKKEKNQFISKLNLKNGQKLVNCTKRI